MHKLHSLSATWRGTHITGSKNTLWHKTSSLTQLWGVWCRHICERLCCVRVCVCMLAWLSQTPENALKVAQLHIWICSFCKSFLNVWIILTRWQILPRLVLRSLTGSQLHYWSHWIRKHESLFNPLWCKNVSDDFLFNLLTLVIHIWKCSHPLVKAETWGSLLPCGPLNT